MGNMIMKRFITYTPMRVIMIGLDNTGKSTVLEAMQMDNNKRLTQHQITKVIPESKINKDSGGTEQTAVFCIREIKGEKHGWSYSLWCMSGKSMYRSLWHFCYQNATVLIFVIDSTDRDRLSLVKEELTKAMGHEELAHTNLLILCTKGDLPNSLSSSEIINYLKIDDIISNNNNNNNNNNQNRSRKWNVIETNPLEGIGIRDAKEWIKNIYINEANDNHTANNEEKFNSTTKQQ